MGLTMTWAAGAVYLLGAVMLLSLSGYMALVLKRELASVAVAAPAFGALYFLLRCFMVLRPKLSGK
jgi:hypothetical protein